MTEHLCTTPSCARPRPESQWICVICHQVLEQDLGSVPALLEELTITLCRLDKIGEPGERGSAEQVLAPKLHASEAMWVLGNTVGTWVRLLSEFYGRPVPDDVTNGAAAARWLLRYSQSLAMHEAAGEAVDEIRSAVRESYGVIDRPPELITAGPCGAALGDDGPCPATLYVRPDAETVKCRKCGARHDVAEREQWMLDRVAELRVVGTVAQGWVRMLLGKPIPPGTWRSWLSREQLRPASVSGSGKPLYRFGDVHALARRRIARAAA